MDFQVLNKSPTAIALLGAIFYAVYFLVKTYLNYRVSLSTCILENTTPEKMFLQEETNFGLRHGCEPIPQLPNSWPLGIDWIHKIFQKDAEGHLLQFFSSVADDYVPRNMVSQMFLLGPRAYHVMDPVNVEAILSTNFHDYGFGMRRQVFAPLLGDGIFTQEGAAWKHSRELLRGQFVRTQSLDGFREHVDNLITRLPTKGVVDLQPLFFSLTLDTTTALLLGQSCYSLKVNNDSGIDASDFAKSFDAAQKGLAVRFRLAPLHFLYNPPHFRQACGVVHRFVDNYIRDHSRQKKTKNPARPSSFVDQLEKETSDQVALRDQLLNILLAGRDTTACCLSWTVRLVAQHPRVMERLRAEVTSVMGTEPDATPTRDQLRKMNFLSHVIKESLRLCPPVPMNNRTALKTTVLPRGGGPDGKAPVLVRRGEVVSFGQYVIARRKNLWGPNADDFIPERWEGHETGNPFGYAYYPFHGGPRTCLGQDFATMEVAYTIVRLLKVFPKIALPAGEHYENVGTETQRVTLVLSSADGCRVELDQAC